MPDLNDAVTPPMWAYAYQIVPPQPAHKLAAIKMLLAEEHTFAKRGAHTWEGRFVHEQEITHILVVSDTPDQSGASNQRLEAALTRLQAGFVLTAPLEVADGPALARTGGVPPMMGPLVAPREVPMIRDPADIE